MDPSTKIALAGLIVSAAGVLVWLPFLAKQGALVRTAKPVTNLFGL